MAARLWGLGHVKSKSAVTASGLSDDTACKSHAVNVAFRLIHDGQRSLLCQLHKARLYPSSSRHGLPYTFDPCGAVPSVGPLRLVGQQGVPSWVCTSIRGRTSSSWRASNHRAPLSSDAARDVTWSRPLRVTRQGNGEQHRWATGYMARRTQRTAGHIYSDPIRQCALGDGSDRAVSSASEIGVSLVCSYTGYSSATWHYTGRREEQGSLGIQDSGTRAFFLRSADVSIRWNHALRGIYAPPVETCLSSS